MVRSIVQREESAFLREVNFSDYGTAALERDFAFHPGEVIIAYLGDGDWEPAWLRVLTPSPAARFHSNR